MGLLDQAAADLVSILSDVDGGFAVPIRVESPGQLVATINGLATNVGFAIDPETGQNISGQRASVALPIAKLRDAGFLDNPIGVTSGHPWLVTFKLPGSCEHTYKVATSLPDQLGCLVCTLEDWQP